MLLQRNNADDNFINDWFFYLFLRENEVDLAFARTLWTRTSLNTTDRSNEYPVGL